MLTEVTNGSAEPSPESVEEVQNISVSEAALRRVQSAKDTKPEASEEPSAPPPEEEPEEQPEAPPAEAKKDVLSKLDLDEMSENDLRELAEKLGSRAVARYGELTAKRKQAEEQLAALQAEMQKRAEKSILEPKVENNPYASIENTAALQAKVKEVEDVIEWAEETLFANEHYGQEDVVATVDGKELTKAQVRSALLNARKARNKYLPAQLQELQAREQRQALRKTFEETARAELPWLQGEDNDVRKTYESMLSDPRYKQLETAVPEVAPQLPYILAHAANSIYARKLVPLDAQAAAPAKSKLTPPKNPAPSAASSERPEGRIEKALKDVQARAYESGSTSDFIQLRTLQLSKKR